MPNDPWLPQRLTREALVRKGEKRVKAAARDYIQQALDLAAKAFDPATGFLDNAILDGRDLDPGPLLDTIGGIHSAAWEDKAKAIAPALIAAAGDPITPAAATATHIATVRNRLARVPDQVFNTIRGELSAGFAAGESIPHLAGRVDKMLANAGSEQWAGRATTIARTETIGAFNAGSRTGTYDAVQAVGGEPQEVVRQWVATFDGHARPSHEAADGLQVQGQDAVYTLEGCDLLFPGDPDGCPEEVINCRCTEEFLLPGMDGYPTEATAAIPAPPRMGPMPVEEVQQFYGSVLSMQDSSNLARQIATDLGHLTDDEAYALMDYLSDQGGGIYIGDLPFSDLDSLQRFKGVTPRGWPAGKTWDDCPGGFNLRDRVLAVGHGARSDGATTVLHEASHALDHAYGQASHSAEWAGLWDDFAAASEYRLNPYFGAATNPKGYLEEAWAEAHGAWVRYRFEGRDRQVRMVSEALTHSGFMPKPQETKAAERMVDYFTRRASSTASAYSDQTAYSGWSGPIGTIASPTIPSGASARIGTSSRPSSSRLTSTPLVSTREERAMTAAAPEVTTDLPSQFPFHGVFAPEGLRTGDGRSFAEESLTWAVPPLPFRVQNADQPGHDGAVRVGRIDNIWRDTSGEYPKIRYEGAWAVDSLGSLTEAAAAARDEVRGGYLTTVSVDLDSVTVEFVDSETGQPVIEEGGEDDFFDFLFGDPGLMVVTAGRIRSATACSIGAFQEAYIADGPYDPAAPEPGLGQEVPIVPDELAASLTPEELAEVTQMMAVKPAPPIGQPMRGMMPDGETECSCDDTDPDYDPNCVCGEATAAVTIEFVSEKPWGNFTEADYTDQQWKDATLIHLDPAKGQDPLTKSLHKVPVYEPAGALNRAGCHAAAGALAGARGGVDAPADKKQAAATTLIGLYTNELNETPPDSLYRAAGKPVPKKSSAEPMFHLVASLTPVYPAADFTDPGFTVNDGRMVQATDGTWGCPLTIDDDGHIYGHLAKWGTCHIGFDGVCVTPPVSAAAYAYFTTGSVTTDAGDLPVGQITLGTGHATATLGARPAVEHYDNTGTAVADIAVGDDEFGIWYSGRVRDTATPEDIVALRHGGAVSGDWRKIGAGLELVAALAVNTPGFPMPRLGFAASGAGQTSLVAAGMVAPSPASMTFDAVDEDRLARRVLAMLDRRVRVARLAQRVGRDPASRIAAAVRQIEGSE